MDKIHQKKKDLHIELKIKTIQQAICCVKRYT